MDPLLQVRTSCKFVADQARHVKINERNVMDASNQLKDMIENTATNGGLVEWDSCSWHYQKDVHILGPLTCQYIFVLDALNFCFWPTEGLEYDTLALSLKNVLEADETAFNADKLSNINEAVLQSWFPTHILPNIEERVLRINELGLVLSSNFNGLAINLVKQANRSCSVLVRLILQYLPGFRDTVLYHSRLIHLYKRAQILTGDLWAAYGRGKGKGRGKGGEEEEEEEEEEDVNENPFDFFDIDLLTMFPDYRVPQILREMGVLEYTPALCSTIDSLQEIPFASEEEVEIRACTVIAVEKIYHQIKSFSTPSPSTTLSPSLSSSSSLVITLCQLKVIELDWLLWQIGEERRFSLPPHHRTRTIYY